MSQTNKAISRRLIHWIIPGFIAVLLIFLINTFFLQFAHVPSYDMHQSYSKGDLVLVNKFPSHFKHYDILAFNYYEDDITDTMPIILIQRCIGLPGDTVELDNGFVYVNNNENKFISELQFNYHVKAKRTLDSLFLKKYHLEEGGIISDELDYSFSMNWATADSLKKDSLVAEMNRSIEKSGYRDERIFPSDSNYKWNKHNYGLIHVPKKNDTIKLSAYNISLYKKIISAYENNLLDVKGDSILINGQYSGYYVIKQDYYFVMGDNRDNAIDSRYWGFLPKKFIIGKVIAKLRSGKE